MPHTENTITAPVSIPDVQNVLGTAETSVVKLCSHPAINMWSLHKPISHSSFGDLTDAQLARANFGFSIKSYATPNALYKALVDGAAWEYNPPTGAMTGTNSLFWEPCRIGDFRGYDHSARPFITSPGEVAFNPDRASYTFFNYYDFTTTAPIELPTLRWANMYAVNGNYPCVAVIDESDGSLVGFKTGDTAWGSQGFIRVTLTVEGTNADFTMNLNKNYRYVLCVSTVKQTKFTPMVPTTARFYAIPAVPNLTDAMKYSQTISYLKFTILGVLGATVINPNTLYNFLPADDYMGFKNVDGKDLYLGVGGGQLALLLKIENNDTTQHSTTYMTIHSNRSLVDNLAHYERGPIYQLPTSYKGDSLMVKTPAVASTDRIAIPANSARYFVLYLPYLTRMKGSLNVANTIPVGAYDIMMLQLEWSDSNNLQMLTPSLLRAKQGASGFPENAPPIFEPMPT